MKNNKTMWVGAILVLLVVVVVLMAEQKSGQPASDTQSTETSGSAENTSPAVIPASKGKTPSPSANTPNVPTKNIVQLTSSGFKPFLLEINRGESVEFINASNNTMVIKSQTENPANAYPGFSQESGPLGKGGKYYFAFTTSGAWPYYNLNTITGAKFQGVIVVK